MKFTFTSLRGKLFSFIALIFVIVVCFSAYLFVETIQAKGESQEINEFRFPVSQAITRLLKAVDDQNFLVRQSIHQHDTLGFSQAEADWIHQINPDVNLLATNKKMFSAQYQHEVDSLSVILKRYRELQIFCTDWIIENHLIGAASADSMFLASLPERQQNELTPKSVKLERLSLRLRSSLSFLQRDNDESIQESIALINEQASTSSWMSVIFGLTAFLILLTGSYLTVRTLNRSIKNPENLLQKLVDGDTSEKVALATDEMRNITESSNKLSENLQHASAFAQSIGEGNFNFDFKPLSEKDMLGNSLVQMRDKLKSISEADRKRSWANEGLAKFADIMRKSDDYQELSNIIISELVKYTKSNQGGLFVVNRENENDLHLQLTACYAFERRKFLEKRVEIGEGLLGQCFLEGQRVYLQEVPSDYVLITSGLGTSNPNSLLVVPLKVNDLIEGVIELASFKKFEQHELEFVEKVGEIVASAISSSRINDRTKVLLAESQEQSEEMRAQEEEMRQNMEEMQATQEQMQRQADEMRRIQKSLELEKSMLQVLMEFLPDRITYKDRESRILRVNKAKAIRFNMPAEDFVGKTDYDFFNKEHAEKAMADEKALLDSGVPTIDVEERYVFAATGDVGWGAVSRIPFKNDRDEVIGMIIIAKDTTKLKVAESGLVDREKIIDRLLDNMAVFRYVVARDGKLHSIWKAKGLKGFDPATLESKEVMDVFPEVADLIAEKEDNDLVCKELVEINGEKEVFKHFLFKDSAHEGVYLGFALKQ